ncbi:hypothetical protein [Streptomyces sp. CB01201]|uniref:hypothetical protein n=1 Tax=Streptomyces sp. CB01201 TaxID=2020324 RepID=UPI00131C2474|nr:hypothetical protein [Streptomyces sp. CB01201]
MTKHNPPLGPHTALLKAALAAAGLASIIIALDLDTRWPYIPAAALLLTSAIAGRRP